MAQMFMVEEVESLRGWGRPIADHTACSSSIG